MEDVKRIVTTIGNFWKEFNALIFQSSPIIYPNLKPTIVNLSCKWIGVCSKIIVPFFKTIGIILS